MNATKKSDYNRISVINKEGDFGEYIAIGFG